MTKKRCNHCLTKAEPRDGYCPVCGIVPNKAREYLSPAERKIRRKGRTVLLLAICHLLGAVIGLAVFYVLPGFTPSRAILAYSLAMVSIVIGIGLLKYTLWGYRFAVTFYFLLALVNVVSVSYSGVVLSLIGLYIVGNRTAKNFFERQPLPLGQI